MVAQMSASKLESSTFSRVLQELQTREKAELLFQGADGGKVDFPEIEILVEEGHAVGVLAGLLADVADNADFGFLVLFGPAKDELLVGGELMTGKNAGAVKAEEDGSGGFGENAAVQIAADEEDGNFLGTRPELRTSCGGKHAARRVRGGGQISTTRNGRRRLRVES